MPVVNYLWDEEEDNIIAEYDENGNVIVEYTTEPGLHGAVISEHRNGHTHYHHHDGQGNTRALTDEQGDVTDTFAYNASGEVTERTGTTPTPFQFGGEHGYYTDQTTGEVMMRRRDYDPPAGRWLSVDPSGFLIGSNLYQYAGNNPITRIDPSGLQWTVKIGPVDFKDRCGLACEVDYEFFIANRFIPKAPIPAQVWALNWVTIYTFDKNCKWEQQSSVLIDPVRGRIERKGFWQIDILGQRYP